MENLNTDYRKLSARLRRISAGSFALALAAMQVAPAYATIDNSVTVHGTAPGGVSVDVGIAPLVEAHVAVVPAIKEVLIEKTATFTNGDGSADDNGKADPGDIITYLYKVTNNGNVTVRNVAVTDAHDGVGTGPDFLTAPVILLDAGNTVPTTTNDSTNANTAFDHWDKLGPGDVVEFTSKYTVVTADIAGAGGGVGIGQPDGDLDNTATVAAQYIIHPATGPDVVTDLTASSSTSVPLDIVNKLTVTKVPSPVGPVAAGTTITYTYTVKNEGNTPISNIDLHDTHKGQFDALTPVFSSFTVDTGSGHAGNTITILQPGDIAIFTVQYLVTQSDVDNLQ